MPTGYTAGVQDGSIETLEQFARQCARAMGAMRDLPLREPIPDTLPESDVSHLEERLKEVTTELVELQALDERAVEAAYETQIQDALEADRVREETRQRQRARYKRMLEQVLQWNPPSGHRQLQTFMAEQLRESIRFDTSHIYQSAPEFEKESPTSWYEKRMARLRAEAARLQDRLREQQQMNQDRQKWWDELRASL